MSQRSFTNRCFAVGAAAAVGLLTLGLIPGCMLEKQDDGQEYREAVPPREAVELANDSL